MGAGTMPGADRAEEAEDEVVVVRQDERDPVALAQAERLERAAEARAHPLDGREGEGSLARVRCLVRAAREAAPGARPAKPGTPVSGTKRKPRVGSAVAASSMAWMIVRGGMAKRVGKGRGKSRRARGISDGVLYQSSGIRPTPKPLLAAQL